MTTQATRPSPVAAPRRGAAKPPLAERALSRRVREVPPSGIRRVLRHRRDDARRHQPRHRRAGLRHARADRRGGRPQPARGPHALHLATTGRSSCAGRSPTTSSASTASRTTRRPRSSSPSARPRPSTSRCARRSTPATRSSSTSPRTSPIRRPSRSRAVPVNWVSTRLDDDFALDPADARGRDHAAHEGPVPRLSVQPDRRGARRPHVLDEIARIAERHDLLVISDEIYDRLVYGDYRHRAFSALPGMRERTILLGRLLQGLRDDRLAGRLPVRARGHPRGDRQGPPVRDHVRADDGPGRRAGGARVGRAGRRADGRRVRPAAPDVRRRPERHRPADVRAARRVLRVPADHLDRPRLASSSASGCFRGARRGRARAARSGRPARATCAMCYATGEEEIQEALVRIGRFVERARAARDAGPTGARDSH